MKSNTKKITNSLYHIIMVLIVLAVVVLVNFIVFYNDKRIDLTDDQRFSFGDSTKEFFETEGNIKNRINFKIYLDGPMPAEVKVLQNAIQDKLDEIKSYAGDRVEYEFINPHQGTEEDQKLLQEQLFDRGRGIRPTNIQYKVKGEQREVNLFAGALVVYEGSEVDKIQFLTGEKFTLGPNLNNQVQRSINNLEYEFMETIRRVTREKKKTIAFLHGHGEIEEPNTVGLTKLLEKDYGIVHTSLDGNINALDGIDGLIIADPKSKFSNKDLFLIDQYLLEGGNILIAHCPIDVNNDSLRANVAIHSTRKRTGLTDFTFDHGIKINEDLVVDNQHSILLSKRVQKGYFDWYFYVKAQGTGHPVSALVEPVTLRYASSLNFVPKDSVSPTILLTSSSTSKIFGTAPMVSLEIERMVKQDPAAFWKRQNAADSIVLLGAMVEGKFESMFKNRVVDKYLENKDAKPFLASSKKEGKMMVVSNGNFFKNSFYQAQFKPELGDTVYYPIPTDQNGVPDELFLEASFGNFDFARNAVDYLLGDNTLLSVRSKSISTHAIDKTKVKNESGFYQVINLVIPLLIVALLGLAFFIIRKRRYRS